MSVQIKVVSLKGQVLDALSSSCSSTVCDLKYCISQRMNGQRVTDMRLIYRAKFLSDDSKTLAQVGIKPGQVQLHMVSRLSGGGRSAVQEVAYQLRFVKSAKLFNVMLVEPEDEFAWNVLMRGPKHTPYAGGLFSITIRFPGDYPYSAPTITFNTPIFHPNIFSDGQLCWHEHDDAGSKYFADVLIGAINALLEEPNPDSPANSEAAHLYRNNRGAYVARAKQVTSEYALQ